METAEDNGMIKIDVEKLNILDRETGVYNSDFFLLRLNEEIKRATRYDLFFSFIMIGLNNRRMLFETLEERTITNILEEIGYTIKDNVRGDVDLVGHIEEGLFALLVPETDIHGAYKLAKRIKNQLDKGLKLVMAEEKPESSEDLSVRIGIIEVPEDAQTSKVVIKKTKRAFMKGKTDSVDNIGLTKPLEKYPSKKKKIVTEEIPKKEENDEKPDECYLPFMEIISKSDMPETEKPDEIDVKILKELEKQKLLCGIIFEEGIYIRKSLNAFGGVKLLNQKRFVFVEDPSLKTVVACVTPHSAPEIRENILKENTYFAGTVIYSYKELKALNSAGQLTSYNTDYALSPDDRKLLRSLDKFKGSSATEGTWIIDPKSPFDPLYMMVRRRYLFKADYATGIYYQELLKDDEKKILYPVYPNCRLTSFEAMRLLKKNIPIEIVTGTGFNHVIHNQIELELFHQVEA